LQLRPQYLGITPHLLLTYMHANARTHAPPAKQRSRLRQPSNQCPHPYLALQQQLLILPQHELMLRLPLLVV
jgi:hypothetical protein